MVIQSSSCGDHFGRKSQIFDQRLPCLVLLFGVWQPQDVGGRLCCTNRVTGGRPLVSGLGPVSPIELGCVRAGGRLSGHSGFVARFPSDGTIVDSLGSRPVVTQNRIVGRRSIAWTRQVTEDLEAPHLRLDPASGVVSGHRSRIDMHIRSIDNGID